MSFSAAGDDFSDLDDLSMGWAPWTSRPKCVSPANRPDDEYCVYTCTSFNKERGLSVVTTPTLAEELTKVVSAIADAQYDNGEHVTPESLEPPSYVVKDIPGKGKGVVSTRIIREGETILIDQAAVLIEAGFPDAASRVQGLQFLNDAVDQLPSPQIVLGLSHATTIDGSVVEDVLRTNMFTAAVKGGQYMALFPEIARINHDCKPNSFIRFSQHTLSMRAIAFHDIPSGEEVSITYMPLGIPTAERRGNLHQRWGFECACKLCTAAPGDSATSDERRTRIRTLRSNVLQAVRESKYEEAIQSSHEALDLLAAEDLVPLHAEYHGILARLYAALGQKEEGLKHGRQGLEIVRSYGSIDDNEQTQKLEGLLREIERSKG